MVITPFNHGNLRDIGQSKFSCIEYLEECETYINFTQNVKTSKVPTNMSKIRITLLECTNRTLT